MQRDARKLLFDVQEALASALRFVRGKDFAFYLDDELVRASVVRKLEIAGEALSRLRRLDPELASRISEVSAIIGFRNVLVHGYDDIDNLLVWRTVETRVPGLIEEIGLLIEDSD